MPVYFRATIAVADNDEAVRESLAVLLESHGFRARAFSSGRELLHGHAAEPADCLVVDHQMPGLTGLDVLQMLRGRGDTTPVILLPDTPDSALYARANSLGAATVLYKPASHAELMVAVQRAVASGKRQP